MSQLVFALVLTAAPGDSTESTNQVEPRPYHEISAEMRDLMKRESAARAEDNKTSRALAIRKLAVLYEELKRDPRLEVAPTIQKYKATLWSRLTRIKKELQREIERNKKKTSRASDEELLVNQQSIDQAAQSLSDQMALVSQTLGGPVRVFAESGGAFGGGAVRDYGTELVELIERVIQPEFWDTNGGPGAIFYYAPLRVLVVRATSEVHFKIGGGVKALRDAGR